MYVHISLHVYACMIICKYAYICTYICICMSIFVNILTYMTI